MSDSSRARLEVQTLDDRTVPSTVTSTATVRPLDFTANGTLTTTAVNASGPVALTNTATTSVSANGQIDYTSATQGAATLVSISGTGSGTETAVSAGAGGGRGAYAQTVQGLFSIADDQGAITTPQSLTGTVNWLTPTGASGIDLIGPQPLTGSFDTSTFKMNVGWSSVANVGSISVTLAEKQSVTTDLAFGDKSAALALDGSLTLDFSAMVTGNLLRAATHTTAATGISAVWQGENGQTEAADLNVAIFWNTGTVNVHAEGLSAPAWAKRLVVKLDAGALVSEGNENNNTWTVTLADLLPPSPPPPPPPPPPVSTYVLVPGETTLLQWRSESGQVLAQAPAIDGFNGPVTIATGDVNGDGVLDVAIGAGMGGGPRVRVVDGRTGADLVNFFAYDSEFRGGVHVALANVSGDSKFELITGAGEGGGPHIRIINAATGETVREYMAFNEESRDGVAVAAGDLNGDGKAEVIATPALGVDRMLVVFNGATGAELYEVSAPASLPESGVGLNASIDPFTGAVVVRLAPDDGGPMALFRSQLAASEPLLVPVSTDPVLFPDPVTIDSVAI